MTRIILYPDGHAEIDCGAEGRVVADGSGKRLTEEEARAMLRELLERQALMGAK